MSIQKIICLGIGSNSFSSLNTVSFGIKCNDKWLLVDCGPDIPRQIQKAGIAFDDVGSIILTHSHLDHTLGLPYLLFGRNLATMPFKKKGEIAPPLKIISEKPTWETLKNLFDHSHPDILTLNYECNHIDIPEVNPIEICDGILLSTVKVSHSTVCYGLRIEDSSGFSFSYSSDSRPNNSFIEMAKGSQVLVLEGMVPHEASSFAEKTKHSTTKEAGEMARLISCPKTFIVHLRPMYVNIKKELEKEASGVAGFEISYPEEGGVIWQK